MTSYIQCHIRCRIRRRIRFHIYLTYLFRLMKSNVISSTSLLQKMRISKPRILITYCVLQRKSFIGPCWALWRTYAASDVAQVRKTTLQSYIFHGQGQGWKSQVYHNQGHGGKYTIEGSFGFHRVQHMPEHD